MVLRFTKPRPVSKLYDRMTITHALRHNAGFLECTMDMCINDASIALGISLTTFKKAKSAIFSGEWPFHKLKSGMACEITWEDVQRAREDKINTETNEVLKSALVRLQKRGWLMRSMFDPVLVHERRMKRMVQEASKRDGEFDLRIAATPMESLLIENVPAMPELGEDDIEAWMNNNE